MGGGGCAGYLARVGARIKELVGRLSNAPSRDPQGKAQGPEGSRFVGCNSVGTQQAAPGNNPARRSSIDCVRIKGLQNSFGQ